MPRHLPGTPDLEVLARDRAVLLGESAGDVQLPRPGGARVLVLAGGGSTVEQEPQTPHRNRVHRRDPRWGGGGDPLGQRGGAW